MKKNKEKKNLKQFNFIARMYFNTHKSLDNESKLQYWVNLFNCLLDKYNESDIQPYVDIINNYLHLKCIYFNETVNKFDYI